MSSYKGHILTNNALTDKKTVLMLYIFRLYFVVTLLFSSAMLSAQQKLEFNVVSFKMDQFSTTAQDKRYEKIDGDGYRYAIIKVKDFDGEGGLDAFTFNFGTLNSIVETHDDELWVYVQRNAKTVTIKRPGYKTIEKYDLNTTLQSGRTYIMTLTMSRIRQDVVHDITKQVLQFFVTPYNENAIVKVKKVGTSSDFELWGAVDETGSIDKIMDFGTYDYVVSALNYESTSGRIILSDSKNTYVENVALKPNFGFLVVDDSYGISGAQIFVDDVKVGTVPYHDSNKRWSCGEHRIAITNGDLYKPYNSTFTIHQGDTTHLSPKLESDFAQTTIHVNADAEIFIDGKSKGRKIWTGPLKAGKYVVECKQDNHRTTSLSINVKADKSEIFEVPAPIAITGSLYVRSTPTGAVTEIDGKEIGQTPQLIQNLLIGNHVVRLSMPNHKTEEYNVLVREGQTDNVDAPLSDIARMTIASKPSHSQLIINGKNVGYTPYTQEMSSGDYEIEMRHKKYKTFKGLVHLDSSHPTMDIQLKRQYQLKNQFYLQPMVQFGSHASAGVAIGCYIANVNVEADYVYGFSPETVYWNSELGNSADKPYEDGLYSQTLSVKSGYGFVSGYRARITPQVGAGLLLVSGRYSRAYAVTGTMGVRLDYAVVNHVSIAFIPEYCFNITESDVYKSIAAASSKIKGWGNGFNLRLGLNVYF